MSDMDRFLVLLREERKRSALMALELEKEKELNKRLVRENREYRNRLRRKK